MTDREVMQQALEALEWHYNQRYPGQFTDEPRKRDARALRALKKSIAQPKDKP